MIHVVADDPDVRGFEEYYAAVGPDLARIPWAALRPHPELVAWLDTLAAAAPAGHPAAATGGCTAGGRPADTGGSPAEAGGSPAGAGRGAADAGGSPADARGSSAAGAGGRTALVIGCGLGDDAEEVARRGWRVTAFDAAPTAIRWCLRRFPGSPVEYRVADLFALPDTTYDLVVEINTIQALPPGRRPATIAAIAATVAPGGTLFVRCLAREDDTPPRGRPWPVSRAELAAFGDAGLRMRSFADTPATRRTSRHFCAVYERA
ncbi:MAG TPA: class I SAM-dependent methyltransferase [Pseudonocardiaceae bacterium]